MEEQASLINIDCVDPLGAFITPTHPQSNLEIYWCIGVLVYWCIYNSHRPVRFLLLAALLSGRTALLMAIDNENLEMIELLLEFKVAGKKSSLVIIIIVIIMMAIIVIITMAIITMMTAIIKKLWQVETKDAVLH